MSLNRREFIQACAVSLCAGRVLPAQAAGQPVALPVPPLLESRQGQPVFLTLQGIHQAPGTGGRNRLMGINGHYPAPTIRVWDQDDVKLIYSNRLDQAVAMTVCGLQVPGALIGGASRVMPAGGGWAPVLPVRQRGATLWYRASTPGQSARQLYQGLAGMWLVEDKASQVLPLPRHYGVDDFPLILQDKRFDRFGSLVYQPDDDGFFGDTLLVNGVQNPYLQVSRSWVRLRLLNASNARRYVLQMSDNRPMQLIANDQGLLDAPVAVSQLSLAPGERREILLDMSDGQPVAITSGESAGLLERLRGLLEPSRVLSSNLVLMLKPGGLLPLVTSPLPQTLLPDTDPAGVIRQTRVFSFADEPGINGQLWDGGRIDVTTGQGSHERWLIHADNPQPFQLQGARFHISKINGAPPLPEDRGWKDTVWVDGQVELDVYFANTSSPRYPFFYASQTMELADRGSMGQILVNPAG